MPREALFGEVKEQLLASLDDASGEKAAKMVITISTTVLCGMGGTGMGIMAVLVVQSAEVQ